MVANFRRRLRGQLVEFKDRKEIERWLLNRPREDAVVIAARAALRALPALASDIDRYAQDRKRRGSFAADILTVFRASAAPWAVAKYPASRAQVAASAASAASFASAAAAFFAFAASSASASSAASFASDAAASFASAFAAAAYAAASADATALEAGTSSIALAGRPLWPVAVPDWAVSAWRDLKAHLLAQDEDWEVWTEWYEARLQGKRAAKQSLEIARVTLDQDLWKAGPKAVNAEIRRLIDDDKAKARRKKPAELADETVLIQRPSSHAFEWRGDRIEATPATEPPFDPVLAETIAAELREKAAEILAGLTGNHADPVVTRAVERALALLSAPVDQIAEGVLLMRADTLAAQARSYADAGSDRERSIRAMLDDVATGVGHLVDCYPGVRRINANRLALGLQADRAPAVEAELRAIASVAEESPAVAPSAREALRVGRETVEDFDETLEGPLDLDRQAVVIENRGETVSARLLDATNFVSALVKKAGQEAAGLGGDSWRQIRKHLPKAVGKGVAKGTEKGLEKAISGALRAASGLGALALAHAIAGNWGAVATLVPMLGPHARKLKSVLRWFTEDAREDAEDPPPEDEE